MDAALDPVIDAGVLQIVDILGLPEKDARRCLLDLLAFKTMFVDVDDSRSFLSYRKGANCMVLGLIHVLSPVSLRFSETAIAISIGRYRKVGLGSEYHHKINQVACQ